MRKPAKTINEFVNNLFLGALTQEQADFYVPFYDFKTSWDGKDYRT